MCLTNKRSQTSQKFLFGPNLAETIMKRRLSSYLSARAGLLRNLIYQARNNMITDSEFIIMDGWKRTNQQYLNDVNFLSSEIYRLVDLINRDRETLKILQDEVEDLKGIVEDRTDALIIEANVRERETVKSFYLQTYLKIYYRIAQEMMQRGPTSLGPAEISNIFSEAERLSSAQTISFLQMRTPKLFNSITADELINMTTKNQISEKEND